MVLWKQKSTIGLPSGRFYKWVIKEAGGNNTICYFMQDYEAMWVKVKNDKQQEHKGLVLQ